MTSTIFTTRVVRGMLILAGATVLLGFGAADEAAAQCGQITVRNQTSSCLDVSADGRCLGRVPAGASCTYTLPARTYLFRVKDGRGGTASGRIAIRPRQRAVWTISCR